MELEQLKTTWIKTSEDQVTNYQVDREEISWIISKKSNTTISNIKRNMLIKIFLTGFVGIFALSTGCIHLFGFIEEPLYLEKILTVIELGVILFTMGCILIGISITNIRFYRRIKEFESSSDSLSITLNNVNGIIESVMWLGISSDLFVTPLVTGFIAYIRLYNREAFILDSRVFALAAIFFGFGVFSFFMNRWTMHKKFGKHLDKLKSYLKELEIMD